jgi:hypothetical protein
MNKKQKAQQQEAWIKQQERIAAGFIKDRFPEVVSIKIKKDFIDYDTNEHLNENSQEWDIPLTTYALFEIKCPMYECVDGGFDLTDIITKTIKNKLTHKKGSLTCQGWQDQERVGKHQCLTKLLYEIRIEYSQNLE